MLLRRRQKQQAKEGGGPGAVQCTVFPRLLLKGPLHRRNLRGLQDTYLEPSPPLSSSYFRQKITVVFVLFFHRRTEGSWLHVHACVRFQFSYLYYHHKLVIQ